MVKFCGILIKFPSIWHIVGVFRLAIKPDIKQIMKKITMQKEYIKKYISRFSKMKILPHSNVKYSAILLEFMSFSLSFEVFT